MAQNKEKINIEVSRLNRTELNRIKGVNDFSSFDETIKLLIDTYNKQ